MSSSSKFSQQTRFGRDLRIFELCAAAGLIGLIIWKLQFATNAICCGDFDGYYHIKWSEMLWDSIRAHKFPPIFVWLPHTTLDSSHYVDHHFLFHIFQMPFAVLMDLRLGAKVSAALFATAALFACYWLIFRYRIRYSLVWLVALLACSQPFLYRLNMSKAPPFAIIFLVLGIHFLFQKKYWPLIPIAFVFSLTYDMFPLLLLTAIFWAAVIGWTQRRVEWRPLLWVTIGIIAGLIINPYFPKNLVLLYEHLKMKLTPSEYTTKVGGEWYPYDTWEFLGNSAIALISMIVGYIAIDPSDKERVQRPLLLLLISTVMMLMTARWKRIAEYWPPFAVLFASFSLQPWLEGSRSIFTKLPQDILDELAPFFDREEPVEANTNRRELWKTVAAAFIALLIGGVLYLNLRWTAKDIASSEPHDYYRHGAEWMRSNIPSGQIVFNTDWDDFPRLFYFDPTHNYVSGLDPTYLFDKDPSLSRLYDRITLGDENDPGPLIRDRFRSRYVFTDNGHDRFYNNAIESGWFDIVYEDTECTVLRIREEKSTPPPEEPNEPGDDASEPNTP